MSTCSTDSALYLTWWSKPADELCVEPLTYSSLQGWSVLVRWKGIFRVILYTKTRCYAVYPPKSEHATSIWVCKREYDGESNVVLLQLPLLLGTLLRFGLLSLAHSLPPAYMIRPYSDATCSTSSDCFQSTVMSIPGHFGTGTYSSTDDGIIDVLWRIAVHSCIRWACATSCHVGLQPAWNNLYASHYYVRLERRFNQLPSLSSKHHSELTTCSNNTVHCWRHRRWQTNPYPSFVWGEILPVWWNQQVSSQQLRWKEPTLICYPSILFVNALTDATMTHHCCLRIAIMERLESLRLLYQ